MKIAFLTSGLQSGRDGVGDYTTRLAAECARLGHVVCSIALNDSLTHEEPAKLRLGRAMPWSERVEKAREFIARFAPDFVSVQFVPFGFHPRGLDFFLGKKLNRVTGQRATHLMFHEIWIGADLTSRPKHRLVGMAQRAAAMRLVRALRPRIVHTSNDAYASVLRNAGIRVSMLPLFGNIPVFPQRAAVKKREDALTLGFFGTLHPVWPAEPLFSILHTLGKKIAIEQIGHLNSGAARWKKITRDYVDAFHFREHGPQPPEKIAEFFSRLDFGIATTPWQLIGKSGSVAAMLEYGLPVIVNRDDARFAGWREDGHDPLLLKLDENLPAKLASAQRREPRSRLPEIAAQFLADLENAL